MREERAIVRQFHESPAFRRRLSLLTAVPAKTLDFHHLADRRETERGCLFSDQSIDRWIIQLSDGAALTANEELAGMGAAGVTTTYERIQ